MPLPPIAETTDTPVWALVIATLLLVLVTGGLAYFAWRAVAQVRAAVDQARAAVSQLEEVRRDRHVQVFTAFTERWQGPSMAEAFALEVKYTADELAGLYRRSVRSRSRIPWRKRRQLRESRERAVLLRVPNYFEDAIMVVEAGGISRETFDAEFSGLAIAKWRNWQIAVQTIREVEDDLAYVKFEKFAEAEAKKDAERRASAPSASSSAGGSPTPT